MSATTSTTPPPAFTEQQLAILAVGTASTAMLFGLQTVTHETHLHAVASLLAQTADEIEQRVGPLIDKDPVLSTAVDTEASSLAAVQLGVQVIQQLLRTLPRST